MLGAGLSDYTGVRPRSPLNRIPPYAGIAVQAMKLDECSLRTQIHVNHWFRRSLTCKRRTLGNVTSAPHRLEVQLISWVVTKRMRTRKSATVASSAITARIRTLRGQRVILDADLAALYGVTTKRLNEQMRRNPGRFPADFTFQLTNHELTCLRSQNATSNGGRGGRRYLPYAYTEHGALMAANVLNSARAIDVSVYVVRAFVELRGALATSTVLAARLDELEARIERRFADQDETIVGILAAIRKLMAPPQPKHRPIGFVTQDDKPRGDAGGRRSRTHP